MERHLESHNPNALEYQCELCGHKVLVRDDNLAIHFRGKHKYLTEDEIKVYCNHARARARARAQYRTDDNESEGAVRIPGKRSADLKFSSQGRGTRKRTQRSGFTAN